SKEDVVVSVAGLYHREHAFSGNMVYEAKDIFDQYEQELFTAVVSVAEREGKPVSLLVVPGTNVFDTILRAAQQLGASKVVTGFSEKLPPDVQGKLTGDAWERLPEPKPRLMLELIGKEGRRMEYPLGPHIPRLRPQDVDLMHEVWLDLTRDPEFSGLHHYHVVSVALEELQQRLRSHEREHLLQRFSEDLTGSRAIKP